METRRKIIKCVIGTGLASSALSGSWVKPVVDSVILPSHAKTSDVALNAPTVALSEPLVSVEANTGTNSSATGTGADAGGVMNVLNGGSDDVGDGNGANNVVNDICRIGTDICSNCPVGSIWDGESCKSL